MRNDMSITWKWILNLLSGFIGPLLQQLTPVLLAEIKEALVALYLKAVATSNPWDDFVVGFLLDVLGIPRPTLP